MISEIPLIDHPEFPEQNRSLALANINIPEIGEYTYLNFNVIFRNKETGKIDKILKVPVFRTSKKTSQDKYFNEILKEKGNEIDNLK